MMKRYIHAVKPLVERFPRLAMIYRSLRDNSAIIRDPQDTPMGFKFAGHIAMQSGSFEPEETCIVDKALPHVDVFINVGANVGYYCCIALRHSKHVIAFEPIDFNLRYLLRNITANRWESRTEIFPLALSNDIGVVDIFGGGTGASLVKGWSGTSESYVTLVPTSTMDTVLGTRFHGKPCLVLIDVEGAELLVLKGALGYLDADPQPLWMVEIAIGEHQPRGIAINPHLLETFTVFWDHGYDAWTADRHRRRIRPTDIQRIVSTGEHTFTSRNFLFVPKGDNNHALRNSLALA